MINAALALLYYQKASSGSVMIWADVLVDENKRLEFVTMDLRALIRLQNDGKGRLPAYNFRNLDSFCNWWI
jgi:hypothetical protein